MGEIVSASMGVMNPLLLKLGTLMGDEYKKLKGVQKQASFLIRELSAMKAALEKLELMDELDSQAKDWRGHVREMSYDMENCIDDFMCILGEANAKPSFINKNIERFKYLGARHRIAQQMEDLKALALEANERRMRYRIDDRTNPSSSIVLVDPRISAIYKEAAGLVGINGPKKELVTWLMDNKKKLKVVSIVGFGGLGKTTLAKQVYDDIGGRFRSKAFVSVSQRPDMANLLSGLQLKLGMKEESSRACETRDIIDNIRKHLTKERYLIVVDDLWDQSAWNIIRCAFTEADNGSRVIVTTRVDDVAVWACSNDRESIYRMNPLKEEDSRVLFFNRIFGSKDGCPPQLTEVSTQILRKCGGLPLAIITIASLLASCQVRSRDEWESIRNSLGAQFAIKPTLEEMRSILNLSYIHLPLYLRPCFMYFGMYPEDREIQRDDLVRQWVAEDLVSNLHGQDMEVAAKSYFNELINRSLIQPERNEHGELMSCRVHDMMLDLILSKCAEDNFITVECSHEEMAREHGWKYKVRRISLNLSGGGAADEAASGTIASRLRQVRSLARFGESKYIPPIFHFKYLRVILFEISGELCDKKIDLKAISQLFQLRYLKVSANQYINLPTEMQGLVQLETLDLGTKWVEIPSDIVYLPRLSHLIVSGGAELPRGIGNMKSLRTLDGFNLGSSSSPEDIRGLTNLRRLRLGLIAETRNKFAALVSSIGMLHNLRYLHIDGYFKDEHGLLASLSDPPRHIMVLELRGTFPRVPKWFGSLQCLRHLELRVWQTSTEEVRVLGELPPLVYLSLEVMSFDTAVIFSKGSFQVLEEFKCKSGCDVTAYFAAYLAFEAGAMPRLRRLELQFDEHRWGGATPVGLEHLLSLEHIDAHIMSDDSNGFPAQVLRDAESVFGKATQVHPNRPSFTIHDHSCGLFN